MVEEARLSDKGNKAYNTITFIPRLLKICQLILYLLGIKMPKYSSSSSYSIINLGHGGLFRSQLSYRLVVS
jgi:hypothetical protein